MRFAFLLALGVAACIVSGCGGGSGSSSRLPDVSTAFRVLPPSVTFAYTGTASINEGGASRNVRASGAVTIGRPGFIDPRTNTPVLLYAQTFSVDGLESLVYRDFFFSQPTGAVVAHGSEVLGVATFGFTPEVLLPSVLVVGDEFGEQFEPYQTLTVLLRDTRVIRSVPIRVAGSLVDAFEVYTRRQIPFSPTVSRYFSETSWYAPEIAGPVPLKQRITYLADGKAVTLELEMVGIPVLP